MDPRDYADRYARIGISLQWLCGPECPGGGAHAGHPPEMAGKIPLRAGWSGLGYRPSDAILASYPGGANLSVLTGWQPTARWSLAVVDGDSEAALEWMRTSLPPTPLRVRTRRGEHWYYRCTGPVRPRNFRHAVPPLDMEVLGDGRQVVAPPSVHRSRHRYEEVGEPWTEEAVAATPVLDPEWFSGFQFGGRGAGVGPDGGGWPGDRLFPLADLEEAHERALAYLTAPRTPVSVSGRGGDDALYTVALSVLRGFPIASRRRVEAFREGGCTSAPLDARDALLEAHRLICEAWNPRCLDADGVTPYPWEESRVLYKLEQAARADRLPGPDYWLFDDPEHRVRWAELGRARGLLGVGAPAAPAVHEKREPYRELAGRWTEDAARFRGLDGEIEPPPPPEDFSVRGGKRARIHISNDIAEMTAQAQAALSWVHSVYVYDGKVCDVVQEPGQDEHGYLRRPWLRETPRSHLMMLLSSHVDWCKGAEDDPTSTRPDPHAVSALMTLGSWPDMRRLRAIVYTPVLRQNMTIHQDPGYDPSTGLLYVNELQITKRIPRRPSRHQCAVALAYLLDVVRDFPFADPEQARAVWLSAVLTRFCRHAFRGLVPMFLVSANTPSAGKGKVVDTIALIADGRPADKMAYTGDVAEDNRVILSHLMNSTPFVCLDNIPRGLPLASAAFEALLTAPSFGARVVGTSKFFRATFHDTLWSATGNRLETAGDMARRTLRIDIDDRSGRPADREVSRPNLEEHVRVNRCDLVRSVLVLLAGWAAARSEVGPVPLASLASYDAWSDVVRQCVVWCGLPDPAAAVGRAETDSVRSEREVLLQHMLPLQPILPSELSALLTKDPKFSEFRSFLLEQGVQVGSAVSLGKFFKQHLDEVTISEGELLVLKERRTNGGRRYSAVRLGGA